MAQLPPFICDANILPAMCSAVQSTCASFPKAAVTILNQHGLELSDYLELDKKMRTNQIMNYRVCKELERLDANDK